MYTQLREKPDPPIHAIDSSCPPEGLRTGKTQVTQVRRQLPDSNEALCYSVEETSRAIIFVNKITLTKWILHAHKQERLYTAELHNTARPLRQIR